MRLPDNVYNILKWIMLLAVPIGTFVTSLIAAIQTGDPTAIVTAVISGLGSLAGAIIKISDNEYKKELKEGQTNG
jgi:uncharacterized membrane protein YhiD involved in acid resistance